MKSSKISDDKVIKIHRELEYGKLIFNLNKNE